MTQPGPHQRIVALEDCDEDFETFHEVAETFFPTAAIERACTGEECLALLQGREPPDLIVLDLNTPGMDGRDALQAIRAMWHTAAVPVVVLSTSGSGRDIGACYALGATAYHLKPLEYRNHMETVRELLHYWLRAVATPPQRKAPS